MTQRKGTFKLGQLPPEMRKVARRQLGMSPEGEASPAPTKKGKARSNRKHGEMTGVERAYQGTLEARLRAQEIKAFFYEPIRLRLAPQTTYTPDFAVLVARLEPIRDFTRKTGRPAFQGLCAIELVEVKPSRGNGTPYWTEDSRVKFKAAAELFGRLFTFVAVWRDQEGAWQREVR